MKRRKSTMARFTPFAIVLIALVSASPLIASPDSFWPTTQTRIQSNVARGLAAHAPLYVGQVNAETGAPVRVVGQSELGKVSGSLSLSSALNYIDAHQDRFGVNRNELEILHHGEVMGKYYLTARQMVDGRPVVGTKVLLRIRKSGDVSLWGADVAREQANEVWSSAISEELAANALASFAEMDHESIEFSKQVWVRLEGTLYPAWELTLQGDSPLERPHGLISAESGEIIGYYNDVQFADLNATVTGPMYPMQIQEGISIAPFSFQNVRVNQSQYVTDETGAVSVSDLADGASVIVENELIGPWVRVINDDIEDAAFDTSVVVDWTGTIGWRAPDHGRIDEFNMFYHTNVIHEYYDALDQGFTDLDYPVPATVGYGNAYDNAFWSGTAMFYGTGSQFNNLALYSHVIYHEYTHGVTGFIYPPGTLPYTGQSGAMNEGWSDYFACTIHNTSGMAPGINAGASPDAPMRDLNNSRRYPENWVNEVHGDGLIIGGAMWDLRQLLNDVEFSDSLIHYARYGFAETFEGYLLELLEADDDNGTIEDGTPHASEIYEAFEGHGIGPGDQPNLVISELSLLEGTEDGLLLPGEMADIQLTLFNDVYLYPPAATNVTITASAGESITFTTASDNLGDIGPGAEVSTPVGLTLEVATDVDVHYEWIRLTISANDGEYNVVDSIRVTVGQPEILLVNDGPTDYTHFFAQGLDQANTAALEKNTQNDPPSSELMASYPYIIWFTGDATDGISQTEEDQLIDYVEAGGHLVLTGQHIGPQLATRFGLTQLLGLNTYVSDLDEYGCRGLEGEPASEGNMCVFIGGAGANNQTVIGGVTYVDGTRPLYQFFISQTTTATLKMHENGGAAAFFSFGLEALTGISNTAGIADVLSPLLSEMGFNVDVPESSNEVAAPLEFALAAPYPNPFNPETQVAFTLPQSGHVTLAVYNVLGQEVMRALDGVRAAGSYQVSLNLSDFTSGSYFIRLQSDQGTLMKKAVLVK